MHNKLLKHIEVLECINYFLKVQVNGLERVLISVIFHIIYLVIIALTIIVILSTGTILLNFIIFLCLHRNNFLWFYEQYFCVFAHE